VATEGFADPVLLGDPAVITARAESLGVDLSRMRLCDPRNCPDAEDMAQRLFLARARHGISLEKARRLVRRPIQHGMMMLRTGAAEGMVCGAERSYVDTLRIVMPLTELREGVDRVVGMHVLLVEGRVYLFADTTVNMHPDSRMLADIAVRSAEVARYFNLEPVLALLSFSTFGDNDRPESRVVREAVKILKREHPELVVDGEMRGDSAVVEGQCLKRVPDSRILGRANVLIFPDLQSANIAYKLVGQLGRHEVIGPLLYGLRQPINMISENSSVEEIINMAVLSSYEAGVG
jgi:malate dehydrogenase (oxaloacetate-decarboxylating)(NADP+)